MKSFNEYKENPHPEDIAIQSILEMMFIAFDDNLSESVSNGEDVYLNEGLKDKIDKIMSKAGMHVKTNKGLIGHLMSAGKGVGKLFVALIRKDTEGVKKVISGLKKEDVLDFLLRLDTATLHIVSGPIHTIDAITGWHIWANVKEKATHASSMVKDAIDKLKKYLTHVYDVSKAKMYTKYVDQMHKDLKHA